MKLEKPFSNFFKGVLYVVLRNNDFMATFAMSSDHLALGLPDYLLDVFDRRIVILWRQRQVSHEMTCTLPILSRHSIPDRFI